MDDRERKVAELLQLAGETHHAVYRITEGADEDWATWYSDWLVNLSELPQHLGTKLARSELTFALVRAQKAYDSEPRDEPWPAYYARALLAHFGH